MKTIVLILAGMLACCDASAFTQRRSFRGGYPVGTGGGAAARVHRQGALSENMVPGAGKTTGTGRKKNIHVVKADHSFAIKCVKGDPIHVELKEPKGTRWIMPPTSGRYSCDIVRGATARQRTGNAAGGEGTAVATVRRLAEGDVEINLKLMKVGAPAKADPEDTMTIGLVAP